MEKCMQEIGTVHKQGWLTKSPPVTQLNSGRCWKKKYFVILQINPEKENIFRRVSQKENGTDLGIKHLHEYYLVYWSCESEKSKMATQNLSAIPLLGHYHAHKYPLYEQKYSNVIILVTDNRVYFLSAENEEEMESWHFHLTKTLSAVRRNKISEKYGHNKKEKESITDDYAERTELPLPAPRESWTLPRSLTADKQVEKESCQSREDSGCDSPPPYSFLSRCSFGSIHGYHSRDRVNSNEGNYNHLANKTGQDDDDDEAVNKYKMVDKEGKTFVSFDAKCQEEKKQSDYSRSAIIDSLSMLPSPPKEMLLQLPPSPPIQREEIRDAVNDIQKRRMQDKPPLDIYKFSKGPDATTLSLFDSEVKLPKNSLANVTNEGLQICYGDHEILIRRTVYLSDEIIEV